MKKPGLFHALVITAALSTLLVSSLMAPTYSIYADQGEPSETTASSETSETPDAPITPPVTDDPSVDDPIVQPEVPEPAENTVFLTHSTPLRAGEEVTFTFSCNGEEVRALRGSITFDTDLLTYKSSSTIDNSWVVTISDKDAADGTLKYVGMPIESNGASGVSHIFSLTFTMSEDAVTGNPIAFTVSDATASNDTTELIFTGGPVTFLVDRPISDQAYLTALTVETGFLSPSFSRDVTEYRLQVPYQCEALVLSATPSSYAKVAISDTTLKIGANTVTVTVTAESGNQQTYTITVTRLSDPNYIPSSDSHLAGITLSDGMLFPAFTPSVTAYTVYMVNEGTITLTPLPAEFGAAESATLDSVDGSTCTITSFAEDGTSTLYTFKVLRVDTPEQLASNSDQADDEDKMQTGIFFGLLAVVAVSLFFVGFGVSQLVHRKKKAVAPLPAPADDGEDVEDSGQDEDSSESDLPQPNDPPVAEAQVESTDPPVAEEASESSESSPSASPNQSNPSKNKHKKKKKRK